jgi:phage-related protein
VPETRIIFYQDEDGEVPVLGWLKQLIKKNRKGYANCTVKIKLLAESGYELRRPAADYLRDGIYELRAKQERIQYRILYFFHGQNIAILAHAIIKEESAVPDIDIERAINRKNLFVENPEIHTYTEEIKENSEEN